MPKVRAIVTLLQPCDENSGTWQPVHTYACRSASTPPPYSFSPLNSVGPTAQLTFAIFLLLLLTKHGQAGLCEAAADCTRPSRGHVWPSPNHV